MTRTDRSPALRAWAGRAVGFLAGGALGGALVWFVLSLLSDTWGQPPWLAPAFVGATALSVAAVGLPLWWVALRPPRTGPRWGGLLAAWIPVVVAVVTAVPAAVGGRTWREALAATALLTVVAVPLTLVLAAVGALLEARFPRSER